MAGLPPRHPLAGVGEDENRLEEKLATENIESDLHSLSEVATMRKMFLEVSKAKKVGDGKMKEKSGGSVLKGESSACGNDLNQEDDAYTSAPDEELGNADDIDSEEEYRKEMEEQRLADRINGHFSASSEGEEESLESRNERERSLQTNIHYRRRAHPNSSAMGLGVSSRVAAYKACVSSRVSGETTLYDAVDEGGKRKSTAVVTQNANPNLQGDRSFNAFCLGDAENRGIAAVQCGERGLFHPTKAATDLPFLGGSDNYGNHINGALSVNFEQPNMEVDSLIIATNQATLQPLAEVNYRLLNGNGRGSLIGDLG